jgi:hypothetical protein
MPSYSVAECADPRDSGKRLWIVQVRAGASLYLLTKKDSRSPNPVYVRNESGNLPADAARLRALITERIEAPREPPDQDRRVQALRGELFVTRAPSTSSSQRPRSETFFIACAVPKRRLLVRLDKRLERSFLDIVEREFPKTSTLDTRNSSIAEWKEIVARDWYELQILHPDIEFERRWRIKSNGDFGFVSQPRRAGTNNEGFWSLFDITIEVISVLRAVASYWRELDYFGEFLLVGDLGVRGLTLLRRSVYPPGLASVAYTKDGSMDSRIVSNAPTVPTQSGGLAELETNVIELEANTAEVTASVLNQLLRSMGYSGELGLITSEVQHQIGFLTQWRANPAWFRVSPHPSVRFLSNSSDAATS